MLEMGVPDLWRFWICARDSEQASDEADLQSVLSLRFSRERHCAASAQDYGVLVMIRRRPIPRTHTYPAQSLRYSTILDGAVRVYPDGREVCQDSPAGWKEYSRRIDVMLQRQQGNL